jgi:SAM-dependent methyltransferase
MASASPFSRAPNANGSGTPRDGSPANDLQITANIASTTDTTLKHPNIAELLCPPDNVEGPRLRLAGEELIGASWRVPVIHGVPDFVTFAPRAERFLKIEIPVRAIPPAGVLKPPSDPSSRPQWFREAGFKYPLLRSHTKGFLLDAGAGQGNRGTYVGLGYDYIALDLSFDSRQAASGEADIDIVADCHRLPLRSSSIEVINCSAVLEHLYCPPIAVREFFRILKPGGLLIGSCSFLEGEHFDSQQHYSHLGLFRLLEGSGLKVMRLFPGQSLWESHANNIFLGLPAKKLLGRLHRRLYLSLVKLLGSEPPERRLLRFASVLNFAAEKPAEAPIS